MSSLCTWEKNLTSPIFSLNETVLAPGHLPKEAPGQTFSIQSPFPDLYPSLYLVSAIGLSLVLFVLRSPVQTSSSLPPDPRLSLSFCSLTWLMVPRFPCSCDSDLVDILPHPQVNKLGFNVTLVRLTVFFVTFDVQTGKLRLQWSGCLIKVTEAETADERSNPSQLSQRLSHLFWSVGHASLCHLSRDPTPVTLKSAHGAGGIHGSGLCLFLVWATSIHCVHSCQRVHVYQLIPLFPFLPQILRCPLVLSRMHAGFLIHSEHARTLASA